MLQFTTTILKFEEHGEKTGWTYIEISAGIGQQLKPDNKKSFRVKGYLDKHPIEGISLLPMGNGNFIMPINATLRKSIRKQKGAILNVQLEVDTNPLQPSPAFIDCLQDEPIAFEFFNHLSKGNQNYFIKWIQTAKTEATIAKRIAQAITALSKRQDFAQMLRAKKIL